MRLLRKLQRLGLVSFTFCESPGGTIIREDTFVRGNTVVCICVHMYECLCVCICMFTPSDKHAFSNNVYILIEYEINALNINTTQNGPWAPLAKGFLTIILLSLAT